MVRKNFDDEGTMREARNMGGWLKLLGIAKIIQGALLIITVFGALPGAIIVWEGILLSRAANGSMKVSTGNMEFLDKEMLSPLKIYFIIQGILVFLVVGGFLLGGFMFAGLIGTGFFVDVLSKFNNF